jgi:hypothetical protein
MPSGLTEWRSTIIGCGASLLSSANKVSNTICE